MKTEFRNLVGQKEYRRYMDIGVATYYKTSFSSYVTAIRFSRLGDVTNNIKRRRSDGKKIREVVNGYIVLNFAINDLRSGRPTGRSGRRAPTLILSNRVLLPFFTTDSSELTRACRGVRYIMAETPTLLPYAYSILSRHVRTYVQPTLHFTVLKLSSRSTRVGKRE